MQFNESHPLLLQSQASGLPRLEANALAVGKVPNRVPLSGLDRLRMGRNTTEQELLACRAGAGPTSSHSVLFPEPDFLPAIPKLPDFFYDLNPESGRAIPRGNWMEKGPPPFFSDLPSDLKTISWRHPGEYIGSAAFGRFTTGKLWGAGIRWYFNYGLPSSLASFLLSGIIFRENEVSLKSPERFADMDTWPDRQWFSYRIRRPIHPWRISGRRTVASIFRKTDLTRLKGARPVAQATGFQY